MGATRERQITVVRRAREQPRAPIRGPRPLAPPWRCLLVVLLASCRYLAPGPAAELRPVRAPQVKRVDVCAQAPCRDSVDVIALGVAGYLFMGWRDTTHLVMTPPAFRHPSLWRVLFWDLFRGTRPDTARITRRLAAMPAASPGRLGRVRDVLVGHGHYDHLLDLPPLVARMPEARVSGSRTVVNLLHGDPGLRGRLDAVESRAAYDSTRPGSWVPSGPWRFKPFAWQHARNFPGVTWAPGDVLTPLNALPRTAAGWKMGRIHGYTLDLMGDDGAPACRFIIGDAAASSRVVARTHQVWEREVPARGTIAIVSAGNYDRADAYPDTMLSLVQPGHVLIGHWEEFFRSPEKPLKRVRGIDGNRLRARVETAVGDRWTALEPGAVLRVGC
jgi:hypothetical protein